MISEPAGVVAAEDAATARPGTLPMRVLLVEDDEGDAFLVRELLLDAGSDIDLVRVRSLAEATGCYRRGRRLRAARPRAAGRDRAGRPAERARAVAEHRRAGAHRSRRRAPRHRGGGRRRAGLPGQGQHRRAAADPGDPLRRRAQARRRVGPPPVRQRGAGRRERPAGARPAPAAVAAQQLVPGRPAVPAGPAPVPAGRGLLRRRRVRRRSRLRADRRRRRARAGRGGARGLPADRLAHPRPVRSRPGRDPRSHGRRAGQRALHRRGLRDRRHGAAGPGRPDAAHVACRAPAAGVSRGDDGGARSGRGTRCGARRPGRSHLDTGRPPGRGGHLAAAVHRRPDRGLRRPPRRSTSRGARAVPDAGRAAGARAGPRPVAGRAADRGPPAERRRAHRRRRGCARSPGRTGSER